MKTKSTAEISADQGAALDAGFMPEEPASPQGQTGAGMLPAPVDPAKEWSEIPAAIGMALSMPYPELRDVYTHDACMAWGTAMVPIAERYGWKPGTMFPWLSLIGATAMLVVPTVRVMKAHQAGAAAAPAEPAGPGATVTPIRAMPIESGDVELMDPTKKNPPPRPVA